jgi:hypothetical protein
MSALGRGAEIPLPQGGEAGCGGGLWGVLMTAPKSGER